MPKPAAPRFKKRHGLKAESLNAVSQNGVGSVSASGGGFSRVGGGGGLGYVPPNDRTQSRFILATLGAGEEIAAPVYKYPWTEQEIVGNAVSARSPGRSGTLTDGYAISVGGGMIADGRKVLLYAMPSDDPLKAYVVVRIDGAAVPLLLTQTGGVAGDATTQCSYTYTVKDMANNEIATGVNPAAGVHKETRPAVGERIAATAGVGTFETGELVILTTNEKDQLEACA